MHHFPLRKYTFLAIFWGLAVTTQGQEISPATEQQLQQAADLYFSYQPQQALEKYIQISKDTQNRDAFLNAVFIAMEQNETKLAVDIATVAYRSYPQDKQIIQTAAEAYLSDGQYTNAEMLLSQLNEEPGRSELLHINLARAQLGMNEKKLAKSNLRLATRGKVHTALSNYLLGILYEEEKNYKAAVKHFKIASEYDHQFIEAKTHYAAALEKTRNYNEAYRQYRMVYALEKYNPDIKNALAQLRPKLTRPEKELTASKTKTDHTIVKLFPFPTEKVYPREIKVGLGVQPNGRPSPRTNLRFIPSHDFTVTDDKNKIIARGKAKEMWTAILEKSGSYLLTAAGQKIPFHKPVTISPASHTPGEGHSIIIKQLMSGAGMTWASIDDKEYRGKLQIIPNTRLHTLVPVNIVTIDEYLQGVIPAEMPALFPMDALRAQAVLARTYALKHLGKHKSYGYDVCDTQNCQVYGGVSAESERANAAVESTIGQTLSYQGKPIESVFSANCGGITQSSKDAGWSETPYLHPVSDYKNFDFEHIQPYHFKELLQYEQNAYSRYDKNVSLASFRWVRVVEEKQLREVIKRQKKDIGEIKALIPLRRGKSGYVSRLLVKGTKGSVTLNKENVIRNNLSLGLLRSSYFIIEPNYENHKLKYFVFYGGGWGHGVGFDQTGAAGRAEDGQDYKTILQHYFPKAEFIDPLAQEQNLL